MDINRLKSPSDYRSERQNIFQSLPALEWFMRRHRRALNEAAALVTINRRLLIDPEPFDAVVMAVGTQQASGAEA